MNYEVILKYHVDENTGEYGLAPIDTITDEYTSFNAFWGADGIFHDVFEHYFEGKHKYFKHKAFMTIFGEACASGHALAYKDIGIDNFMFRKNSYRNYKADTIEYLKQGIYNKKSEGNCYLDFEANKNVCIIPYQSYTNYYNLENTISDYIYEIKEYMKEKNYKEEGDIWLAGITRAYRYGYKQALKIIGKDRKNSYNVLNEFLYKWNNITTKLDANSLFIENSDCGLHSIKFKIYHYKGLLRIETFLIDDFKKTYNLEYLSSY